jgi:hypothetical protein
VHTLEEQGNFDLEQSVEVDKTKLDEDPEADLEANAKDSNEVEVKAANDATDAVDEASDGNTDEAKLSVNVALKLNEELKADLEGSADRLESC